MRTLVKAAQSTLLDVSDSEMRRVRAFYDDLAPTFDRIYADWDASVKRQGEALHRLLVHRLGDRRLNVLDCSCGIGTQTIGLLARGHVLVGSDLSPDAVRRARRESAARGYRALFAAADMCRLPFRTAAFDAVVSGDNSLPHLLTQAALHSALIEMARVTKPGGALLVSLRDYAEALMTRPASRPPSVSGGSGSRTITFQLWHWHDDSSHYDVEMFQLEEQPSGWAVTQRTMPSWALSRPAVEEAADAAGWKELTWMEPIDSDFFQPVLLGTR